MILPKRFDIFPDAPKVYTICVQIFLKQQKVVAGKTRENNTVHEVPDLVGEKERIESAYRQYYKCYVQLYNSTIL